MPQKFQKKTGSGIDLAFAVVVLASYFATFSMLEDTSNLDVFLMVTLGIAYIAIGIYGFSFAIRSNLRYTRFVYFLIQIPLGGVIVYLSRGTGFNAMVLFPLAGQSVLLLPPLWLYAANLGINAAYIAAVLTFSGSWADVWAGLPTFLAGQIFIILFTQMAVNEERGQTEVERLIGELGEANQQLRDYALQVEELTITKERNRMAREIHDGLGHYLTTIHIQIQAATAILTENPSKSREALKTALSLTQDALAEIRSSVASLRASDDGNLPLEQRIRKILENCSVIGITPRMEVLGEPHPLPPTIEWTLYRAAQEGINNACKHSQASRLTIILDYTQEEMIRLNLKDNGVGCENRNGGFGLIGLEERVNLLNGEIMIQSARGEGFEIEIGVPYE